MTGENCTANVLKMKTCMTLLLVRNGVFIMLAFQFGTLSPSYCLMGKRQKCELITTAAIAWTRKLSSYTLTLEPH